MPVRLGRKRQVRELSRNEVATGRDSQSRCPAALVRFAKPVRLGPLTHSRRKVGSCQRYFLISASFFRSTFLIHS